MNVNLPNLQITLREQRLFFSREHPDLFTPQPFILRVFPAGTVFSQLRRVAHGRVSGISSPIRGKRYFVDSIPDAELWGYGTDSIGVGYYHCGSRKNKKNKNNKKNKRRSKKSTHY
jgi:hypothetical protein